MRTSLYIGTELADFSERFNVTFSIGDVRDLSSGNCNKSYTLDLPLTRQNKKLLKFITQTDVKTEPSAIARLFLGELLVISGIVKVLGHNDSHAKVIIDSDEWIDPLKGAKMTDLDLSAHDHALSHANVENSWSAAYPFYRYPMINFGALSSGASGTTAKWSAFDFIPAISVAQLITKILSPYSISSSWLASSFVKDLFILCRESLYSEDFIKGKQLTAVIADVADNDKTGNIPAGSPFSLGTSWIPIMTASTDEGSDYSSYQYTVPADGTYRFSLSLTAKSNEALLYGLTIASRLFEISIVKGAEVLATKSITTSFNGQTLTIKTAPVHCEAGDIINPYASILTTGSSSHGSDQELIYGLSSGSFENIWGPVNRYTGIGKTISLEEMLPDMSQADFLSAIKGICNLVFWFDKMKRTIYIEPWDQFLSSNVIDLTEYIDHASISTETISGNFYKTTRLKWKEDLSDYAFKDYMKYNSIGPGSKDITLSSLYVRPGTETREHPFSSVITAYNRSIGDNSVPVPTILESEPISPYIMFERKTGFNTRIVEWKGLTSGFTWYYDTETKTQYPKVIGLDFASIYSSYWQKFFHYVDKGKIVTARMKVRPTMISQFFTVIATAANEAFRPTYKINIKGIDNYFFLQRMTTDGQICELELVLKS